MNPCKSCPDASRCKMVDCCRIMHGDLGPRLGDPADKRRDDSCCDNFGGTVHRAGYGTDSQKLNRVMDLLARHPDATLTSGEGKVLYDEIQRLRELLIAGATAP